jgi:hypothetical protein
MSTTKFEVAGTAFELVMDEGAFNANPSSLLTLPTALVCGMSSASYNFTDEKQALLDALSPFQIVSKFWSTMAVNQLMHLDPDIEAIVYVGSWYGQQSAIASRFVTNYADQKVYLVDKDPVASRVAQYLINHDSYHRRVSPIVWMKDIFTLTNEFPANTLFVWNGMEHFDNNEVETFLEQNTESTFLFQSTNMEAKDHTNLATHISDLLACLPVGWDEEIVYSGEIECELGSRYMMAVRGPGCEPLSEEDPEDDIHLDGPNR